MLYFILMPDYTDSCLVNEEIGKVDIHSIGLTEDLISKIKIWHEGYRKIIPLTEQERLSRILQIERLDKMGLELAQKIAKSVPGGAKVRYFSEGKLRYLYK